MRLIIFLFVGLLLVSFVSADAMWVWNKDNYIINEQQELVSFSKSIGVDTIYLHFTSAQLKSEGVPSMIKYFKNNGLKVYYLTGDRPWAEANGEMKKRVENSLSYSFDGVHFDVERNDWFDNDNSVAKSFLSNLKEIKETYPKVSLDIPFWLDTHSDSSPFLFNGKTALFSTHLRDYTEFLTIMDYREKGEEIISFAANEIKEGPTVIGVEFMDVEPETITFNEEGLAYFIGERKKVLDVYGNVDMFGGFAYHYYKPLKEFLRKEGDYDLDGSVDKNDFVAIKSNIPAFVSFISAVYQEENLVLGIHKYFRVISKNWGLSF